MEIAELKKRIEELERENADLRHDIERHIGIATEANQEADTLARAVISLANDGDTKLFNEALSIATRRINGETE